MKTLVMSDIHCNFGGFPPQEMPEADVVLIAGDITNVGATAPLYYLPSNNAENALGAIQNFKQQFTDSQQWMAALAARYQRVYWIPGNHDLGVGPDAYSQCEYVNFRSVYLPNGMKLHGVSMSPSFDKPELAIWWANMTTNPRIDAACFEGVGLADIVLSHCPPQGCLDATHADDLAHCGSPALRNKIEFVGHVQYVVCGHVHECGGMSMQLGHTTIVNTAKRWMILNIPD
jgi:Icc-related predicted phosphoesterase